MANVMREKELRKKKQRKIKLSLMRRKFMAAQGEDEKNAVLAKVKKISPAINLEGFLKPLKQTA